ncbi:MAG TPA: Hpt domain-containing protein [Geothrix sp.]
MEPVKPDLLSHHLEGIPGLDADAGLNTVGGRVESLVRLLRRYEELHAKDSQVFRDGIAKGDSEGTCRLAHSLKSAAGFLGLVSIQALAAQLEAALREGAPPEQIEGLLVAFERENDLICASIRAQVDPG